MPCSPSIRGILAHAQIQTPLTARAKLALLVVNSVKLHLTACTCNCKWDDECVLGLNIFIINSFLCDQNGMRAKLKAADSNEIDTMFMDKRSSVDEDSKGNILVGQWCMQGCQWAVTSVTAEQACVRLVVTGELDCS